jgi:hypothetical protein
LTATRTVTPELGALVVHTQTAKLATAPGFTRELAENDCTWTQSCGVFGFGFGAGEVFVGLGDGVGFGDVGLGDVGLGDGGGLELDGEFVLVGFGDGSLLCAGLGLELSDCVGLVVGPEVGPALGVSVGVTLALELDVEVALAWVLPGFARALLLAGAPAGTRWASRVAFFGMVLHAALTIGPTGCTGPLASAAKAWPSMLKETKAKPVRAPTTAGRTTRCALTPDLTSRAPAAGCPGPS